MGLAKDIERGKERAERGVDIVAKDMEAGGEQVGGEAAYDGLDAAEGRGAIGEGDSGGEGAADGAEDGGEPMRADQLGLDPDGGGPGVGGEGESVRPDGGDLVRPEIELG